MLHSYGLTSSNVPDVIIDTVNLLTHFTSLPPPSCASQLAVQPLQLSQFPQKE